MDSFYITLQSDSAPEHYPGNKITNFKNRFAVPLRLDRGVFEVALVECTYVHSNAFIKKGELIFTEGETKKMTADKDYKTLNDLQTFITKNIKNELKIENKTVTSNHPNVTWSPKVANILGYENGKGYIHECFFNAGQTLMFVYCDIIDLQRIGNEMAPLLRRMIYSSDSKEETITTREFTHLQYANIVPDEIDTIHMYIMSEIGEPIPLSVGSFSATLHIRRRRF
jgi:hypothetical protein